MSNTIRIKRGKSSNLSVNKLQDGELAITLDTNKLYTNKGQISPDNVYIGDTEPTDLNVECWISPSGKMDLSSLWDQIYPVGSIYTSINATNPSTLFGGVWEQIASGRTLVGVDTSQTEFNTVKKIGGSKTVALTVSQMPSHTHTQNAHYHAGLSYGSPDGGANTCVVSTDYNSTGCIELGWSRSETGVPYDNVYTKYATATNNNTGGGASSQQFATLLHVLLLVKNTIGR